MSYLMEGYNGEGLCLGFENCECICIAEGCIKSFQISGIKKTEHWTKQDGWDEYSVCEGAYISLKDLKPEHEERLLKYNDITTIQLAGKEYVLDFRGEHNNRKQKVYKEDAYVYINIGDHNIR